MRPFLTAMFAVAALTIGASAFAQTADKATIEKGMKVYDAQKCSLCHSIAGKGNPKGPLDEVGGKLTADEIRQWIVDPKTMTAKAKATRTPPMKAYPSLPKDDLDALVAYIHSLKKK